MRREKSMGEYFARLSSKYDVYTGEFFHALLTARENGKSDCGSLSIDCRSKTTRNNIFLIKHGSEFVAQFQVPTDFLLEADVSPLTFINRPEKTRRPTVKQTETPQSYCIRDLHAGMNHVNLKAKVLEVTMPKIVNTRYGTIATLVKALIGDETGTIQLCLWNEQAKTVSVGETIVIENARASKFGDKTQLSVGTKGKLIKESSLPMSTHLLCELAAE
ncbi:MAG TPA: hypothetical protein VJ044_08870 [Candidatus Hodarchaeales archaeon]|nr:hypothetical protein [Candidatus Hodarchaeales archaeon]